MGQLEDMTGQQIPPENDSHVDKADRLLEFFILHKNKIIAFSALAILFAGGLLYLHVQRQSAEETAHLLVSNATVLAQQQGREKAVDGEGTVKGLREIIREYGSTPSGNFAKILIADGFFASRQIDSALVYYRAFSGKNRDLAASAIAGEAACLVSKKNFSEAAPAYEKASETAENPALKALYLSDAGDSYLSLGNVDKAVDIYKRIVRKYAGFTAAAKAEESLLTLAGKTGNIVP